MDDEKFEPLEKSDTMKDTEKAISTILETFSKKIEDERAIKHSYLVNNFVENVGTKISLKQFWETSRTEGYNSEQKKAVAHELAVQSNISSEKFWKFESIYLNYDFVRVSLRNLFSEFEGSFACNDKAVHISEAYRNSIVLGEVFEIPKEHQFYMPMMEAYGLWLELTESLLFLHSGHRQKYLEATVKLEDFYRETLRKSGDL